MMRQVVAFGFATLVAVSAAAAHEIKHKSLKIVHPWVFETEGPSATLRVTLKNGGKAAERLLRGSTQIASKLSIVDAKGKEQPSVIIPARGELALKPDSLHIMLYGLRKPLRAYDSFDITLVFERAGPVKVEVLVEEVLDAAKKTETGG